MRARERLEATRASEVESGLEAALRLSEGWDGYDAKRVAEEVALFALDLLDEILPDGAPAPSVVPTPGGGVQLEWHEEKWQLELEIVAPDHVLALGNSRPPGSLAPIEEEMHGEFERLRGWIARAQAL